MDYDGFAAGAREITVKMTLAFGPFTEAMRRLNWSMLRLWYFTEGRTRRDGRPRRSGHRHRGTYGWGDRYRSK